MQGGEKTQGVRAGPTRLTNEVQRGSLRGEQVYCDTFGWTGVGVIVVHVERVACKKAGCHEFGTD